MKRIKDTFLEELSKASENYKAQTGEAKQTENKYSIEDIDRYTEKQYNKIGDENERTEDFRRLQSESKGLSEKDSALFRSGDRRIDDGLRARFERIFTNELLSGSNGTSDGVGLLRLYSKKTPSSECIKIRIRLCSMTFLMSLKIPHMTTVQ